MKSKRSPQRFLKRFAQDEQGGVLILFGLGAVFLTAIGGAAVDLGTQQLMRLKLQNSVDAAVTSAGSLISCQQQITVQDRQNAAQRYFMLNYPERYADNTIRPTLVIDRNDADQIRAHASDDIKTNFVNNFAIRTLAATASSGAIITDRYMETNFDAVMVIDETGSMRWGLGYIPFGSAPPPNPPYEQSRAAAAARAFQTFTGNMFPDCIPNPNVRVGMVGFAGFVTNKWALSSDRAYALGLPANIHPVGRNMEEIGLRAGTNMLLQQPGADKEIPTWNSGTPKDDWYGSGPEGYGLPASYKLPPAQTGVSEKRGASGEGITDLSIDFDTRVPLPATARNKDPEFRHMIVMSDGTVATDSSTGFRDYGAMLAECKRAKDNKITVHTINFTTQDENDKTAMRNCASSPANSYNAPTEEELKKILIQIGSTIRKTRIVQ